MDKTKYKKEYRKNRKRRLFKILFFIMIISIVFGILYVAIISKNDRTLIKGSFDQFFISIQKNQYNYTNSFVQNLLSNVCLTLLIWILGISVIGVFISIFYLIFKSFVFGFSVSSILYTYGFKGLIPCIIYSLPLLFNLVLIFILTFYAVNFSKKLYLYLFRKKDIDLKRMVHVYSKFLFITVILLIISSLFSGYIVPIMIKTFTNLAI